MRIILGEGFAVNECPISYADGEPMLWVELFHACHNIQPGFSGPAVSRCSLPYKGTVLDQPAPVIAAFKLIEGEIVVASAEKDKTPRQPSTSPSTKAKAR